MRDQVLEMTLVAHPLGTGQTDVTIDGTPANHELLVYDSASGEWVNHTAAEAGLGSGDVTAAANLTDNAIVRGDGGAKGVQTSTMTVSDTGHVNIVTTQSNGGLTVESDQDQVSGAVVVIRHNTDSPANLDTPATVIFQGKNLGGGYENYGKIESVITDNANGAEVAKLSVYTMTGGTSTKVMDINHDGTISTKLDDLGTPDDNTDLDFSTSLHGLVPKGTNVGNFLKDDGTWAAPAGGGDVTGPGSSTDNAIARFNGVTGKIIQDYTSNPPTISDTGDITVDGDLTADNIITAGNVDGRDVSTDGTKLDGIEALADVTDATNVDSAGATMNTDADLSGTSYFLDEDNMASNSAVKVASQQSIKAYADTNFAGATHASNHTDGTDDIQTASISQKGIVAELATAAETTTGTDATRVVTPDGLAGSDYGKRIIMVRVVEKATALTTGDGKENIYIPSELNGYNLVDADACVDTVSSSGTPTVAIYNATDSQDMLSTNITIDANERTSYTAATQPVINTSYDDVATGDCIRVDVDVAGTGTTGLVVILSFQKP